MKKTVSKIVIAAAGYGTRFSPISNAIPKEMLSLINKPAIHYVLEESLLPSIKEVVLVINKGKESIVDYLTNHAGRLSEMLRKIKLTIVFQEMDRYGDAIPIVSAKKYLQNSIFLVLWADFFSINRYQRIKNLFDVYSKYQRPTVSFIPITSKQTSYSAAVPRIKRVNGNLITFDAIVKNPGPIHATSLLTAPSGFILNPDIFQYLDKLKPNKAGEYCLIDALDKYCRENVTYGVIFKKPYFETGNPTDLVKSILKLILYEEQFEDQKRELKQFVKELKKEL